MSAISWFTTKIPAKQLDTHSKLLSRVVGTYLLSHHLLPDRASYTGGCKQERDLSHGVGWSFPLILLTSLFSFQRWSILDFRYSD